MKTRTFPALSLTIVALTALVFAAGRAVAQDATTSSAAATGAQPAAVSQAAPQLSYGVPEVLQLSQAKVGDSVIVSYIQNSGNNYGLNAAQIIYLRQQGVSDTVINTMLNQRSQSAQTATTSASDNSAAYSSPTSTATAQPTVTSVQTVPTSTVYVVPDTQTYYYNNWLYSRGPYYGYYPYYGYCWPYPAVSVSFGWGGGWGGYRGGWHGGGGRHH
ncbi:MAG: hypothetical protein ACREDQ_08130 [Limisphaerales bacterium]